MKGHHTLLYQTPRLMAYILRLAHKHKVNLSAKGAQLSLHLPGNGFLVVQNQDNHVVELTTYLESRGEFIPDLMLRFYIGTRLYGKDRWFPFAYRELFGGGSDLGELGEKGAYLTITDYANHRTLATNCETVYLRRLIEDKWLGKGIAVVWPPEPKPLDCEGKASPVNDQENTTEKGADL